MFKKLFLSIIILSALASENGAYYAADLFDLYLVNLTHLDMIQDSRNAVSILQAQKEGVLNKRGKPLSFFKAISEEAINRKLPNRNRHFELISMSFSLMILCILVLICLNSNINKTFFTRRALFSRSDSSPPVCC